MRRLKSNNVVITNIKAIRLSDSRVFTCIIPDVELGYYKSLLALKEDGFSDVENLYIELELVKDNSTRFRIISNN